MNGAFNESSKEREIGNFKLLSEAVTEVEALTRDRRPDCYPRFIYNCANEEMVDMLQSKYSISEVSDLSPKSRFVVEDNRRTVDDKYDELEEEMAELKGLVKDLVLQLKTNNTTSQFGLILHNDMTTAGNFSDPSYLWNLWNPMETSHSMQNIHPR